MINVMTNRQIGNKDNGIYHNKKNIGVIEMEKMDEMEKMEFEIERMDFTPSEEMIHEIKDIAIGKKYITQKVEFKKYVTSQNEPRQTIKISYAMDLKISKKYIMGNLDIINAYEFADKFNYSLNSININKFHHDNKKIYIEILYIKND